MIRYQTIDNKTFPAVFSNESINGSSGTEFIQRLRDASKVMRLGQINLPNQAVHECHMQHTLASLAMQNPIAYVQESKTLINNVMAILIGCPPEGFPALDDGKSSRKTRYFKSQNKGVFGHTLAYFGMIEDHQKGTLHYHFCCLVHYHPTFYIDLPICQMSVKK